jgi:hypothetical protein
VPVKKIETVKHKLLKLKITNSQISKYTKKIDEAQKKEDSDNEAYTSAH